jgi:hypothetical protein
MCKCYGKCDHIKLWLLLFGLLALCTTSTIAQVVELQCDPPMTDLGEKLPGRSFDGLYAAFAAGETKEVCQDQRYLNFSGAACYSVGQGRTDPTRAIWKCISNSTCGDGNTFSNIRITTRMENGKKIARACATYTNTHSYRTDMNIGLKPQPKAKKNQAHRRD